MTVLENLVVAQHNRLMSANLFSIADCWAAALPRSGTRRLDRRGHCSTRWVTDRADWVAGALLTAHNAGWRSPGDVHRAGLLCLASPRPGSTRAETADLNDLLRQSGPRRGSAYC